MSTDVGAPEGHLGPMLFHETGPRAGQPGAKSTKVGFTTRNARGDIVKAFAFLLNPQSINRTPGVRAQLYATQGAFYVDEFGPGPTTIVIQQLVASGKHWDTQQYTAREDVQRWIRDIYVPATSGSGREKLALYFHDNHYERGHDEHVFIPDQGLQIARSVSQPGVWAMSLTMVSLERYPYADDNVTPSTVPLAQQGTKYLVVRGDTLQRIVARLAGRGASATRRKQLLRAILRLNPWLRHRRTLPNGKIAKPMRPAPGEVLTLPH